MPCRETRSVFGQSGASGPAQEGPGRAVSTPFGLRIERSKCCNARASRGGTWRRPSVFGPASRHGASWKRADATACGSLPVFGSEGRSRRSPGPSKRRNGEARRSFIPAGQSPARPRQVEVTPGGDRLVFGSAGRSWTTPLQAKAEQSGGPPVFGPTRRSRAEPKRSGLRAVERKRGEAEAPPKPGEAEVVRSSERKAKAERGRSTPK
jgi:hypothetical protein